MKYNKVCAWITALLCLTSFVGCQSNDTEVAALRRIEALNTESELVNVNMSVTEKEAAIYAQVSNRTLLDLSSLAPVSEGDRDAVISYMDSVDAQISGTLSARDGVIEREYTDYLIMEFEKTPYYWQRKSMNIRGMDATSRSIVIDVTYHTIDFKKSVIPNSPIVKGEPNYENLLKVRYERWLEILSDEYGYGRNGVAEDEELRLRKEEFFKTYGSIDDILNSQRGMSLTGTVYSTGNQITYEGLIDNEQEQCGASMTIRYVLVPNYTLGINQGYTCQHMYVLNYQVDKDMTEGRQLYSDEDYITVADNVYNMLHRYYKCLDENNYSGVYKLNNSMPTVDKYFSDYFETTYRKYDSFTLSIFDIKNTRIECGATVSRKVRAKGSNMSLPIYTDRYYYVIELIDGRLQIVQEVLLSSTIEGEPAINTEAVDTTGFTSSISLTSKDKKAIEGLISKFGAQQLLGDSQSDAFSELIDMSLSASQIDAIRTSMLSVEGKTKATWVLSYLQGNKNYASVKCRELVQTENGELHEYIVTYDFICKGGKWLIYNYQILSRAKLDTIDFTTKNSLCVVTAGSVDSLVSQVSEGAEEAEEGGDTPAENVGEVIQFDEFTPVVKATTTVTETTTDSTQTDTDTDISSIVTEETTSNVQ